MTDAHDTETLAEVLAAHDRYEWWPMTREFICTCEASIGRSYPDAAHRQHVAEALAARTVQAAAGGDDDKDHEFGNLRWMDGHQQGLKDGLAEARAGEGALRERIKALVAGMCDHPANGDCVEAHYRDALRAALTDTAGDPT